MFLVYEACLGLYFPAMATCRSKYIEDRVRGTVMNITRCDEFHMTRRSFVLSPGISQATLSLLSAGFIFRCIGRWFGQRLSCTGRCSNCLARPVALHDRTVLYPKYCTLSTVLYCTLS